MGSSDAVLPDLLLFAEETARAAGSVIRARYGQLDSEDLRFKGVRDIVTDADLEAERLIVAAIRSAYPGHMILAEEDLGRKAQDGDLPPLEETIAEAEYCWIVDPLDGTTNYAHSHPFFAVSMACYRYGVPQVGVVHAPILNEHFSALAGGGAFLNGEKLKVSETTELKDAVFATGFPYQRDELDSRENNVLHLNRFLLQVRGFRRCGAAAIDLAYVAAGRYDFYFEAQLNPWDVAAGALLVTEAGGSVSDYENGGAWLCDKHITASNGRIHSLVLETLSR